MDAETRNHCSRSLSEDLMRALGQKIYEAGNFIVADTLQDSCPISFVSEGFCNLTGDLLLLSIVLDFELNFCTGYSRQDCLGRNCKFLQGKDTDQLVVRAIRAVIFYLYTCLDLFNVLVTHRPYQLDGNSDALF
jgi:hypothetical protein